MVIQHAEPVSIEAEQQLLGAALLNGDILPRIAQRGGGGLFFDPIHQRIYEVAERKAKACELVSPVTMHVAMAGDEGLSPLGGGKYLVRLAGASISAHAADDYIAMLVDLRQKRHIVVAITAAHQAITQGEDKADQIAARLEAALILVADACGQVAPVSMLKATSLALAQAHDAYHGRNGDCIASGIGALDEILGGFYPGELIILGGRPSMGKTGIALSISLNAARAGHGVAIASLEMNPVAMAMRALSEATAESGHAVSYASLRRGTFTQSQGERLKQVTEGVAMLPITFLPRQYSDIGALIAGARQVQRAMGGAMRPLIVDYAQLLRSQAKGRYEQITEISIALKALSGPQPSVGGWPMSVRVMAWVWSNGPGNCSERLVLLALADFWDDAGRCWPAMATIAAKACVTERGARNIVRQLEADGWLKTQVGRGRGGCNTYHVLMSSPEQRAGNEVPGMAFRPELDSTLNGTARPCNRNAGSAEPSRTTEEPSSARKPKAEDVVPISKRPEVVLQPGSVPSELSGATRRNHPAVTNPTELEMLLAAMGADPVSGITSPSSPAHAMPPSQRVMLAPSCLLVKTHGRGRKIHPAQRPGMKPSAQFAVPAARSGGPSRQRPSDAPAGQWLERISPTKFGRNKNAMLQVAR